MWSDSVGDEKLMEIRCELLMEGRHGLNDYL
jgi:hypothetical protein